MPLEMSLLHPEELPARLRELPLLPTLLRDEPLVLKLAQHTRPGGLGELQDGIEVARANRLMRHEVLQRHHPALGDAGRLLRLREPRGLLLIDGLRVWRRLLRPRLPVHGLLRIAVLWLIAEGLRRWPSTLLICWLALRGWLLRE